MTPAPHFNDCNNCGFRNAALFEEPTCCAPAPYRAMNMPCWLAFQKRGPCDGGKLWKAIPPQNAAQRFAERFRR